MSHHGAAALAGAGARAYIQVVHAPFLVNTAVVRLAVTITDGAVTAVRLHGRATRPPETALERQTARELEEYALGARRVFSVPLAPAGTAFEQRAWRALVDIPYGETRSYGEVAADLGNPKMARAVGLANHHNPIPIMIPCHRVVAAGGGLGGYGGGLSLKRRLLNLEAAHSPVLR